MKNCSAIVLFLVSLSVHAYQGPVGTPCGGTSTAGTTMTGTQGWSTDPATGQGYWSCCQAGTACSGRDKPARVIAGNPQLGGSSVPVRNAVKKINAIAR